MRSVHTLTELKRRLDDIEAKRLTTATILIYPSGAGWTDSQHSGKTPEEVMSLTEAAYPRTSLEFIIDDIPNAE